MVESGRAKVGERNMLPRRDFLKVGAVGTVAAAEAGASETRLRASRPGSVIQLLLTGGPSQLDTWDPKPDADSRTRGPFRPIATRVPGIYVSELFPRLARIADRIAFLRSVTHAEAPIHETGQQLIQTGRLATGSVPYPHFGAIAAARLGGRLGAAPWYLLPGPMGDTGVPISHGQEPGYLGPQFGPAASSFASGDFSENCRAAVRLVESGARIVTVNMFSTVFNEITWDLHAYGGGLPTTFADYEATVCPAFDQAFATLIAELEQRDLFGHVLIVASGEFGRSPRLNARGGRDHWPGCWTALMAGGGVRGGQVLGASDADGGTPRDRPITPAELVATCLNVLGVEPARPLGELF